MWTRIALLTLISILVVTRQVMLKAGLDGIGGFSPWPLLPNLRALLTSPLVLGSILVGLPSAFLWYWLLSIMPFSVAATILGIMLLVGRMLAAWGVLAEPIPPTRWLGMAVACVGIWLMAR